MKTILVTGAAGFIGSNICDRLLSLGYKVIGIDNLSTGKLDNVSRDKNYDFHIGDLKNLELVEPIFYANKIDAVLHIAGNASIVNAFTDPQKDVYSNIITTMNITNLCVKYKIPRLIHASTMVVYGKDNVRKKEDSPCVPISTYGITKYAAERYVINTGNRTDLGFKFNTTALRMFNVYGPRQDLYNPYQGVVAIFLGKVKSSDTIYIHGEGSQTRDFIYIDDIASAWIKTIDNEDTYGKVFNLGSEKEISIIEILRIIKNKVSPLEVKVKHLETRQGDIDRCLSDSSSLINTLKWRPEVSFEEGMSRLFKYTGL